MLNKREARLAETYNLELFEQYEGAVIAQAARGLSIEEVLDKFGLTLSELNDYKDDLKFFMLNYKQGRAEGKNLAIDHLFKQMPQRGGIQASISYLARFADNWKEELSADGEATGKKTFTISID